MKKKILTAMTCAVIFAAIPSMTALAGQWKQDNIGSWYQNDNGSYVTNDWVEEDGKWYHFNNDGYMQKNEWILHGGKCYYLDADGVLLTNATAPNGYAVDADGVYIFQMPAAGLPSLESIQMISSDQKYTYYTELYYGMYSSSNEGLYKLQQYVSSIPDDMNEIVTDSQYYGALCEHILKKIKNVSLADTMASQNPAIRVYGHCMEEYRQIYIKYLSTLSKNLKNGQYATYLENIKKLEAEAEQMVTRYEPYMNEFYRWDSYTDYYDYYSDYYKDYYDYY